MLVAIFATAAAVQGQPVILTTSLPRGMVSHYYVQLINYTAECPCIWTNIAGTYPPGLFKADIPTIDGTPSSAGSFTFTLKLTDKLSRSTNQTFTVIISPALVITTTSPLPSTPVDQAYSATFAASGGVTPYTWSVGSGLPPGISPNGSQISGTPTTSGTYTFTVQVSDANSGGSTFSTNKTFTLPVNPIPPTVSTLAATGVSQNSGTLNGTVNPNGSSTMAYFRWGTSSGNLANTIPNSPFNEGNGNSTLSVSILLNGLSPNTTYYYQCVGTNSAYLEFAGVQQFTTLTGPPTVTTTAATGVGQNVGTLNGTVNPNGLATTAYFQYGTTSSYGSNAGTQSVGSGTTAQSVSAYISGLAACTTYHYRAVANNSDGSNNGSDMTFTTSGCSAPTVTTTAATGVGQNAGTLNGTVNPNGSATTAYFQYGTTSNYGSFTPTQSVGSGTTAQSISAYVSGLAACTTYYYQLVASNSSGSNNGGSMTFMTSGCGPSPLSINNVSATQQSVGGPVTITYDLTESSGAPVAISVAVSTNNGSTFSVFPSSITGSCGANVIPGNNQLITWNVVADWNNQDSSEVVFQITANGTITANSPAVTVDTLNSSGNPPVVENLASQYFQGPYGLGGIQHVYFLSGVSLQNTFTATVNWNGAPGTVQFSSPLGTTPVPATGAQTTWTADVGSFPAGGTLTVIAVAPGGAQSAPFRANFDVINPPTGVPAGLLQPSISTLFGPSVTYLNVNNSGTLPGSIWSLDNAIMGVSKVSEDNNGDDGDDIPGFGAQALDFASSLIPDVEIDGTGIGSATWSPDLSDFGFQMAGFTLQPNVSGGVEWTYAPSAGNWTWAGILNLGIDTGASTPPFYIWDLPPIYLMGTVDINLDASLQITGWNPNGYLNASGTITPSVTATFVAGCGLADVADFEGYIGGGPQMTLTFPPPTLQQLSINLQGGVEAVFLTWTWQSGLLNYIWCIDGCHQSSAQQNAAQAMAQQLTAPAGSQWKLLPRNYLTKSYAVFMGGDSQQMLALPQDLSNPLTLSMIQSNVFPYSNPSLAVNGTNEVLVWIWDNPSRDAINRTELVWSQWNGSGWSSPAPVWDDATADFHPTVKVLSDGSALAAWENEQTVLTNGATLADALAGLEIAVSSYNPSTGVWTSTNLTQNSYLDRSPQLAAAPNGQALLTWISNTGNSPLGSSTTQNVINCRLWNAGSWQDVGPITTNAGMLLWSAVAFNGSNGVFLAVIDADDDPSTINDQQLYGAVFSNSTWSAFTQLTSNGVQNSKPQAIYDAMGNLLVAWYQGSNLVTRVGDLNLGSPTIVGTLSGSTSSKDFSLVTGPAGQISMIWEDLAANGTGPFPFFLNYDPGLQVWSQPLQLLSTTNVLERSFSCAYGTNGALLVAYNQVSISVVSNDVSTSADSNNLASVGEVDLMYMSYQTGYDLAVSSSNITLSVSNPTPGTNVSISAVVQNIGELAATNVQVSFYDGDPDNDGVLIDNIQTIQGPLSAGSNATAQVNWAVPQLTNSQSIYVVVETDPLQPDRNLANNTASITVMAPDLQISSMLVLTPLLTNRIITATVTNTGVIPVGSPVTIAFFQDATNGVLLATNSIPSLGPGSSYNASFVWALSGLFTSSFEKVYAIVDPGNTVTEFDASNKVRAVSVPTLAPLPPTGAAAAVAAYNQISLVWTDTSFFVEGYQIERSVNGEAFTLIGTVAANGTTFTDTTAVCGNTYTYYVVATNSFGTSDYSYIGPMSTVSYDSEGFGIPDCWRELYFGHSAAYASDGSCATCDADGTGQNNLFKYAAGLNPTNPASTFQIINLAMTGSSVIVTWKTSGGDASGWFGTGKTNVLEVTPGLPNGSYANNFVSTGITNIITSFGDVITNAVDVGGAMNGPSRYYRVKFVSPYAQFNPMFLFTPCVNGLQVDINGGVYLSPTNLVWNWGDGVQTPGWFPQSHSYSSAGQYTLQVTAYYSDGNIASSLQTVNVSTGALSGCYSWTITAGVGGSISYQASVGLGIVPPGGSVTLEQAFALGGPLTAYPSSGYLFSSWSASSGIWFNYGSTNTPSVGAVVDYSSTITADFTYVTTDSVGDGIPDWWRAKYFPNQPAGDGNGTMTNSESCAGCDADGTGQNNLFKYVTGLDPTNPASVFLLNIAIATNQPPQNNLFFTPLALGRTYTPQFSTNLTGGVWLPLATYIGPFTNGSWIAVTDTNPISPQEFYRIQISPP